jgi:hypothetical protein
LGEPLSYSFHDKDAVKQAILALSEPQLLRLRRFAAWRIRGLGRKAQGRTHEDLLSEAITSVLGGTRPWQKSVGFYLHVQGCIRSISNAWFQKNVVDLWFETDLCGFMDEPKTTKFVSALETAADTGRDPEDRAHMKMQMDRVHRIFPCGTIDRQIIDRWANGQNHAETQAQLGMSKNMYNAAVKRIRRTAVTKRAFVYGKEYM